MKRFSLSLLFACLLTTGLASAQEWTRYRGPNGSGIGKAKLPAEFSEDRFAWSIDVPGAGFSSPILWGEKIFLTSANAETKSRTLYCFSAKDGAKLWEKSHEFTPHKINGKFNSHASTSVCTDADRVYLVGGNGEKVEARAYDHEGEELWKRSWDGFDDTDHGMFTAPVLVDGVLLIPQDHIGSGSRIAGLDPKSGDVLWEVARENAKDSYSSPVIHKTKAGDHQAIFVSTTGGFEALDPKTGKFVWEYNPGYKQRSVGSPVIANGIVFGTLGSGGGAKESAALRPGTLDRKPELLYAIDKALPYVPSPLVVGDSMYLLNDGGMLSGIDQATGKVLFDRERLSDGPSVKWFASPVSDGEKIFCASQSGEMVILSVGKKYEVLGRHDFGELINACPAIAHGNLYVRTASKLHCIKGD